ncbi:MAG: winged helix-turn-helix domain-containing protein [Planctomycetia bacterium]|nr:winged helix-turn-helix domain-containing protein [Planctomycetia bacterium]
MKLAIYDNQDDLCDTLEVATSRPDQVPAMSIMADRIWQVLRRRGQLSISGLAREIGAPRDYVMEGLGWLGCEGRITVHEEARVRVVTLRPQEYSVE